MKIFNVSIYGLEESIVRSGYPMRTEIPLDFVEDVSKLKAVMYSSNLQGDSTLLYKNPHFKRAMKLGSATQGSGHDAWAKGAIVQFDITMPQYWWQQAQRYHWFDIVSSQSKMHKILEMDLNTAFVEGQFNSSALENLKLYIQMYKEGKCDFEDLLDEVPMGLEYTAAISTNYLQLKTMYKQRRNHRLSQWQYFCDWCEGLPYFKEIVSN